MAGRCAGLAFTLSAGVRYGSFPGRLWLLMACAGLVLLGQEGHLLANFEMIQGWRIADGNLSGVKVGDKPPDAVDFGCFFQERGANEGADKMVGLAEAVFVERQFLRCKGQGKSGECSQGMEADGLVFFPPWRARLLP